ncbi:MAG: hypothetical protein WC797_03005 [Candidatus Paceibacterota bacterium]|jgi:hypothetical protein
MCYFGKKYLIAWAVIIYAFLSVSSLVDGSTAFLIRSLPVFLVVVFVVAHLFFMSGCHGGDGEDIENNSVTEKLKNKSSHKHEGHCC